MKIRKGFVSNSSSSSFIVAFPSSFKPTEEGIKELLFDNKDVVSGFFDTIDAKTAISWVMRQMEENQPNDEKKIFESLSGYHYDHDFPKADDFLTEDIKIGKPEWFQKFHEYDEAVEEWKKKKMQTILSEFRGSNIYCFEFADDTTIGSVLEHGPTFKNLPHVRVSNH